MAEEDSNKDALMKGFLGRKRHYDDDFVREYCVLSVIKQRMKFYDKENPREKTIISLKGAKIEDIKDREIVVNIDVAKKV
mmetsp:Transcript_32914/g.29799  ORF Transcript_32914/g.29799 Transcript_32914/m.29799 type:complete len:80 (-) Transcript_32914:1020-1259(-)|eukprot:CAMPEP_0114576984 /NCGR_PEP_ID=MMETSP0125-20121206/1694_1 /TAXON_ID=485358 ORGANISM="Aristerostoma sp., Strain ATCC 50986" /NCGR_SAMPLE_ID=MMETSP0125 /ASSEMBLY_ACC=CAM_ASM_000245 /LENGTH=79 /DNA_ID=CAMNT_0001765941 /DNA_START=3150 /DNA_END=3389 /DNA_ORIENTATION=+